MKRQLLLIAALAMGLAVYPQDTYYKGEWSKASKGSLFTCLVHLSMHESDVSGEIYWTFTAADSTDTAQVTFYKEKKNRSAAEYIKGGVEQNKNSLYVEGYKKDDYHNIIGLDKYTLKLSADKKVIYGKTWSNGDDDGLLYAIKMNPVEAEREIMSLRKKIGQ